MSNSSNVQSLRSVFESSKCIVFDWDGTIVDSVAEIIQAVRETAFELNLPAVSDDLIRQGIGLGASEQIVSLYGSNVDIVAFKTLFEKHYLEAMGRSNCPKLFKGTESFLRHCLKLGYDLAISTGKSRSGLNDHLSILGWERLFRVTVCAEESVSKPAPDMLHHISDRLHCDLDQMIMIGDSYLDLAMAQAAGVQGIGVLSGASRKNQLEAHHPVSIVQSIVDLVQALPTSKVSE